MTQSPPRVPHDIESGDATAASTSPHGRVDTRLSLAPTPAPTPSGPPPNPLGFLFQLQIYRDDECGGLSAAGQWGDEDDGARSHERLASKVREHQQAAAAELD